MVTATRHQAAATMAAAVIQTANRPFSVDQAMALHRDFYFSMFAEPGSGAYAAWQKEAEARSKPVT